jgi:hypothetical protein
MIMRKTVNQLTDQELKICFHELSQWMHSGILKQNGFVRSIHEDIETKLDAEIDLRTVEKEILYIMGERFSSLDTEKEEPKNHLHLKCECGESLSPDLSEESNKKDILYCKCGKTLLIVDVSQLDY